MEKSNLKRLWEEDDISSKPPPAKKVRFPKGKKVKAGEDVQVLAYAICPTPMNDPNLAAKERAKRRVEEKEKAKVSGEISRVLKDEAATEKARESKFVEDGVQFDPFNLDSEREEGCFDDDGNFVEYIDKSRIKDAWLGSLEKAVDDETARKFAAKNEDDNDEEAAYTTELSAEEIAKIKRRVADALEGEETVLKALRRLKGNKKEKMSAEEKAVFDQLTEDAMVLMMRNGENNVYDEEKEVFEREAQGYESLAKARLMIGEGKSILDELDGGNALNPIASIGGEAGVASAVAEDDGFNMFGGEDEPAVAANAGVENNGGVGNDYVFDDASGYYYSPSLGYYYDSNTGLYCSAASGLWYSYNEETGAYDEVVQQAHAEGAVAAVNWARKRITDI